MADFWVQVLIPAIAASAAAGGVMFTIARSSAEDRARRRKIEEKREAEEEEFRTFVLGRPASEMLPRVPGLNERITSVETGLGAHLAAHANLEHEDPP